MPFTIEGDDDEVLGLITLLSGVMRGALQSCAFGYWICDDRTGQGHATQAVGLAVELTFRKLELHRVQAETLSENAASQRALVRNGLKRYGFAPQYIEIAG